MRRSFGNCRRDQQSPAIYLGRISRSRDSLAMFSIHFFVSSSILLFAPARDISLELVLLRVLPFAAAIVLVILVTLFRRKKARERTQIMQAAAAQLGCTFSAEVPWNYIPGLDRFTLFTQCHSK